MPRPPNILLIHSDQHRCDCVGANGHPFLRTPHLDRIAREGARFTHAFTPCAICSPARASLLTGAWPSRHKCHNIPTAENHHPADPSLPLVTELLRDAGYRIGHVGKFHEETTGTPLDHGCEDYVPAWSYRAWRAGRGHPPLPETGRLFGCVDAGISPEDSALAWQADRALELLDKYAGSDRPFMVRWDPPEPHLPCRPVEPFASLYPPESIPPWPSFPDPLENKPYAQQRQLHIWGLRGMRWEDWAPIVSRYFAIITELDHHVGRILGRLDALGLARDTLVVYSTDHGDLCGGHGMIDKHFNMYDDIMRVPLLIRWPARVPAGRTCDGFVSHELDLAATFCQAAGVAIPATFQGASLLPLLDGSAPPRDAIGAMYFGTESGLYSSRMFRTRDWKYIYNATAQDELYHLPSDPAEVRNRIDDPSLAETLRTLRTRMGEWMASADDRLWNCWTRSDLGFDPISPKTFQN